MPLSAAEQTRANMGKLFSNRARTSIQFFEHERFDHGLTRIVRAESPKKLGPRQRLGSRSIKPLQITRGDRRSTAKRHKERKNFHANSRELQIIEMLASRTQRQAECHLTLSVFICVHPWLKNAFAWLAWFAVELTGAGRFQTGWPGGRPVASAGCCFPSAWPLRVPPAAARSR